MYPRVIEESFQRLLHDLVGDHHHFRKNNGLEPLLVHLGLVFQLPLSEGLLARLLSAFFISKEELLDTEFVVRKAAFRYFNFSVTRNRAPLSSRSRVFRHDWFFLCHHEISYKAFQFFIR